MKLQYLIIFFPIQGFKVETIMKKYNDINDVCIDISIIAKKTVTMALLTFFMDTLT